MSCSMIISPSLTSFAALLQCQAVEFFLTAVFHENGFGPELVSVVPGYGYAFVKVDRYSCPTAISVH